MAPVVRNRTALFVQFRRSYRATVVPVRQKAYFENEQYTGVAQDPPDAIELRLFAAAPSASWKIWCDKKTALERLFKDITSSSKRSRASVLSGLVGRLRAEYEPARMLAIDWQASGPAGSDLADHLLQQIAAMFVAVQRMIDELAELPLGTPDAQATELKKNVKQAMINSLGKSAELLRYVQAERNKKARRKTPTIRLAKNAANGMLAEQDQQLVLVSDPETLIAEERGNEIGRIAESMSQVLSLLQSMQAMVIEQGSLLDRIDYNLEQGHKDVRRANTVLQKTAQRQSGQQNKQLVLLFLVMMVFLLLAAVFTRETAQRH